ncbi:MAG: prephenate dehydrogenase/arogenate dehydrogenase family protein, partial [Firmicutes bacterium]|nr:prephenate dehydrogenase/arogenate dehydrogenase family protein [Bacillota bacterium]
MGGALATGLVKSKRVAPEDLLVSDVDTQRLRQLEAKLGVKTLQDNKGLVREADVVVLAVKPDMVVPVLAEAGPFLRVEQTVISVAAGIPIRVLEEN